MFKQALSALALPHPVIVFSNGQTALDYLKSTAEIPFLIISEMSMPDMSGLAFDNESIKILNYVETTSPSFS